MFINYSYDYLMKNGQFLGYLQARYDSRNSFYKKAKIYLLDGQLVLVSYTTIVAKIEIGNGKAQAQIFGYYSQTTKRHIDEFMKQCNFATEKAATLKNIEDKNNGLIVTRTSSEYINSCANYAQFVDLV